MLTPLLLAAVLQAAPDLRPDLRPDLGWMAGYWLSCEPGREVSETWTDPRLDLLLGAALTVRSGRAGGSCRASPRSIRPRPPRWPISPSRKANRRPCFQSSPRARAAWFSNRRPTTTFPNASSMNGTAMS